MKPSKRLFTINCFVISVLILSCGHPEHEYFNVTEKYKDACLFYAYNEGDSIKLCKNNTDSMIFIIGEKKFYYLNDLYDSYNHYQVYEIYLAQTGFQYFSVTMQPDNSAPELYIAFDDLEIFGLLETSNYSDSISGRYYSDLFKIRDRYVSTKYIITSRSQGIVYAQNDTVQYVKVY